MSTSTQDRRTADNKWVSTPIDGWIFKARAKISRNSRKDVNVLVHDRDGKVAYKALEMLFNDGYKRTVGVKGGLEELSGSSRWVPYIGKDGPRGGSSLLS